jgi:hypothetical protein
MSIREDVTVIECTDLGYRLDHLDTVIDWTGEASAKAVSRLVEYSLRHALRYKSDRIYKIHLPLFYPQYHSFPTLALRKIKVKIVSLLSYNYSGQYVQK